MQALTALARSVSIEKKMKNMVISWVFCLYYIREKFPKLTKIRANFKHNPELVNCLEEHTYLLPALNNLYILLVQEESNTYIMAYYLKIHFLFFFFLLAAASRPRKYLNGILYSSAKTRHQLNFKAFSSKQFHTLENLGYKVNLVSLDEQLSTFLPRYFTNACASCYSVLTFSREFLKVNPKKLNVVDQSNLTTNKS